MQYNFVTTMNIFFKLLVDVFCGDETLPVKKDGTAAAKDTVHLKWCTPKNTHAPG